MKTINSKKKTAHFVLCHPEPKSFNAHLICLAGKTLQDEGWQVTATNLYEEKFAPLEEMAHYRAPVQPDRFDAQLEQKYASETGSLPDDVLKQLAYLDECDLLVIQYPMWWHLPPAILKGWMDRVFVYGRVYASKKRFEKGVFVDKKAMLSVTVGTSAETYHHNGRSGDMELLLWPVNFSLAYVGFEVLEPFIAYGVEANLRYSSEEEVQKRLEGVCEDYADCLRQIEDRPNIAFNTMADWGADGHIKPDAPVYTPFIRHNKNLKLT